MKDILPLIPQRAPFVMVDELVAAGETTGVTRFEVRQDNIFVQDGYLTEPALIENIAQTAAAHTGYVFKEKNEPVPVGFIGAVQNLEIKKLPAVGDQIETEITIKNQVFDVTLISGKITSKEEEIAKCDMKIFLQPKH
ncbi:MAG: 3-hydroxyacyl-ACP dehydratase [Agriterribacter sp.]